MDLKVVCEVLQSLQSADGATRKAAEEKVEQGQRNMPGQFVAALANVLGSTQEAGIPAELRQQAAVLLRQAVVGTPSRDSVWAELDADTRSGIKAQLLATVERDASSLVRKNAGSVVSAIAELVADDFDELSADWPEVLPMVSRLVLPGVEVSARVTALVILKDITSTVGEGLIAKGGSQIVSMLQACFVDPAPEVRAAGTELIMQFVEDLEPETVECLGSLMPAVVTALQSLVQPTPHEELLKEALEAVISATDEEPEFFKANGLKQLWDTLVELSQARSFSDADVRHSAMEALVSLATGLAEDFCQPDGLALLEQLLSLNMQWMLEVCEDIDEWTAQADEEDEEDDVDEDVVGIAEDNLDRIAKDCDEDVFMQLLFKVIRLMLQDPSASWKHVRAAIMALNQVVEHVEGEAWIDQCVEFTVPYLTHEHPRVRFVGYTFIAEVAFETEPYVQENHHKALLPAMVSAVDDANIRVATNAIIAFVAFGEELEVDALQLYIEPLLTKIFTRLQEGRTRSIQEECLSGIAVVSEVAEELFVPYYADVMPALKAIVIQKTGEKERLLRGKAFECASIIGDAVGKDTFLADAHLIMQAMGATMEAGLAADDPQQEYIHEAMGRIAVTIGRDFKPYCGALLPGLFKVLAVQPTEMKPEDMPDDDDENQQQEDMSLMLLGEGEGAKIVGLKTTVIEEMQQAIVLVKQLMESLEDDFCDFLPTTCQTLLPLLNFQLSDDIRGKTFETWESLATCARKVAETGKSGAETVNEILTAFLKATVGTMTSAVAASAGSEASLNSSALGTLQAQATGISHVIMKAGNDVLSKDAIRELVTVIGQLLARVGSQADEASAPTKAAKRASTEAEDPDEDEESENIATRQSARFCLADVVGALMRTHRTSFAEVGLPLAAELMQVLLGPAGTEGDKCLSLYIAEDIVEALGELSLPCWNIFMEPALHCVENKSPCVRQYACSTLGEGAKYAVFEPMALHATQAIANLLKRHGERHRRRRAVKSDAKQVALAVDAAIRALGLLCEHQERVLASKLSPGDCLAVWRLWLSSLPLRYDQDAGQKAHAQLLGLVVRSHAVITAQEQLPRVLSVLADVYKTKFSNAALDRDIAATVAKIGEDVLRPIAESLEEKHRGKVELIVRDGAVGGG